MSETKVIQQDVSVARTKAAAGALSGLIGGAIGGLTAGVLARIAMRVVALDAGFEPDFSIGGTLFILVLGVSFGAVFGLFYGFIQSFLPGSPRVKGLIIGLFFSLLVVAVFLTGEPEGELVSLDLGLSALIFGPIPLIFGGLVGWFQERMGESNN